MERIGHTNLQEDIMFNESRGAEDGVAMNLFQNEISLAVSVFWDLSRVVEALGSERPDRVSDQDVLVAKDLVRSVRIHWDGTEDEQTLYGVVDNIVDLHPEIIPWLKEFVDEGYDGGMRLFELVAYAHHIVYQ